MKKYDNYLDIQPTELGQWLQKRRAFAEWQYIKHCHKNIRAIAEIGPGYGIFAGLLDHDVYSYVALEANHSIAKLIRRQGYDVCETFTPPLPLFSSSIDLLYASHVIEHMPDPLTALTLVQEAHRVLRSDGLLVLSAPDILAFGQTFWDADYTHSFPVTDRRMRQLLRDGGFEVLEIVPFSGPISGIMSGIISSAARYAPTNLFFLSQNIRTRLDRLRLTFLKNICVIARK